ncbi:vacuolar amino acid transporter 5 [Vararia minispora EC-137]|uniref:Vacuolar amino acid transporter 5 n=1 Tax=Vararia minispora EC-137 TaxID=1314806 RepID=A0ACB8QI70_9AGAM|nr:vacuolar amino acid transporter 5 [Vararia minispora EC-137]
MARYGAVEAFVDPDDARRGQYEDERAALLAAETKDEEAVRRNGHATLTSSVSNLANTIIGSGMLTFPLVLASAGIIPGILTCLLAGSVSAFGLYLLSVCARHTPHRRASFFAVANLTFPRAAVFFDVHSPIIFDAGRLTEDSFLIILKSLVPSVVASLYHDLAPERSPPEWAIDGRLWLTLLMIVLVPLCFMRHLHSLRHMSYVSLFSVGAEDVTVYLILIVIVCYFVPLEGMPPRGEVYIVKITSNFVSTFPVLVFAFTCAMNIFPIYNEVKTNSQARMNIIITSAIGSATLIYGVIAVFGYLTFGSNVGANIVAMYPATSLFVAVGQLAIAVLVLFSYPLQVHPCRNCLDKVFHFNTTAAPGELGGDDGDHTASESEMTPFKFFVLTMAIVASGFWIAFFVDDLQMVLSFVGSTGSTAISFILPGLFYWKMFGNEPGANKTLTRAAVALATYGGFILVFW